LVTEVDHLSQEIILKILLPSCEIYNLAFLSEECPDNGERLHKEAFPLDGTLPFVEGVPGYSVSIGLVSRAGEPIIGVVFDPLTQTLFHAIKGKGVWKDNQPLKPIVCKQSAIPPVKNHSAAASCDFLIRSRHGHHIEMASAY